MQCELLSRSWSDVYRVHEAGGRHVARVWRAGFHSAQQIDFSCRCLDFLGQRGIRVAMSQRMPDGNHRGTVQAPEGARHVALFDWLDGVPVGTALTPDGARAVGALLARLHMAGLDCDLVSPEPLQVPGADLARETALRRALEYRGVSYDALAAAMGKVERDFAHWSERGLPRGLLHGDFHHFNVLRCDDGTLVPIDFDDVCFGPLIHDIASLRWALDFLGAPPLLFDEFLSGYEMHRPLTADERAALPTFLAERDCWNIRGWAANINVLGDPHRRFDQVIAAASIRFARIP